MVVGIIMLLGIVAIMVIVIYYSFKEDTSGLERFKKYDDKNVLRGKMWYHEAEKRRMVENFEISKVGRARFGRMAGSFGRYGYDITNPIVTDDLYKYLDTAVYKGGLDIEDASPICGYKISLFKKCVYHAAVKVTGKSSPILLYFIKGETNSRFYPRDFFSGFVSDLVKRGISPQLRDNTEERLLLDSEENEGGTYKIEKVIRLKDSYIGKNWKQYAKNYKPLKPSRAMQPDVYAAMLQTNKVLTEKARMEQQKRSEKPKCPVQEDGESDEAYMKRVSEYVKADTEWRNRNQGKK